MPVDPDNVPSLPSALHTPFLPGWAEALLIGAFGTFIVIVVWGRRIAAVASTIYRFTWSVITGNAAMDSRITKLETAQEELLRRLMEMSDKLTHVVDAVAPKGERATRDMLNELLRNEAVATARLRAMAETDHVARFECDATGACTHVNDAMCQLFGLSYDRMLKNGWLEAIPHEQRSQVHSAWQHAVSQDLPYDQEYEVSVGGVRTRVFAKTTAVPYHGRTLLFLGTVTPRA